MNIAVLSGKGGTGKTTVSTNLSIILGANYIDCDVEEPNGFIFLNPEKVKVTEVKVDYPVFDVSRCDLCGECAKVCQFHALAKTKKGIILFEKLCHSCRACGIVCENGALTFGKRAIGVIEEGQRASLICKRGVLNPGQPMAVPVIKKLLEDLPEGVNILDCPPGSSCNVVNTLQHADCAILVTEPSVFGLHDLKIAVELVKSFHIPFGAVINKFDGRYDRIQKYCKTQNIDIFGIIPHKTEAAKVYSKGEMLIKMPEYKKIFEEMAAKIGRAFPWK